jgi:TolA-binding protein
MLKAGYVMIALAAASLVATSATAQVAPPRVAVDLQVPTVDTQQLQAAIERAKAEFERARLDSVALSSLDAEFTAARVAFEAALQGVQGGVEGGAGQEAKAREQEAKAREQEAKARELEAKAREADQYQSGYEALSEGRWERAVDRFNRVIELKGERADRALYWKAYAQNKLGQSAEALAALAELARAYPKSRYLADAKALEVEIRERAGQPPRPESQEDEEMKLLALRALQHSDPEQAVPMLESILKGHESPRLKDRALFVLAQSASPRARQVLVSVARGEHNPDLQEKALQYLGYSKSAENRALLADIYRSSSDTDVKRRILRSFMIMGDREKLLEAARTESSPELRAEAARQLGMMKAGDALWELYQKETNVEVKQQILRGLYTGGDATRLIDLAKTEQDPTLRRTAVRNLGMMPIEKSGAAIMAIYEGDVNAETRKAAIEALFIQRNDVGLVTLARKEKDLTLKKAIVERLSVMKTKVALDYLMEILNK